MENEKNGPDAAPHSLPKEGGVKSDTAPVDVVTVTPSKRTESITEPHLRAIDRIDQGVLRRLEKAALVLPGTESHPGTTRAEREYLQYVLTVGRVDTAQQYDLFLKLMGKDSSEQMEILSVLSGNIDPALAKRVHHRARYRMLYLWLSLNKVKNKRPFDVSRNESIHTRQVQLEEELRKVLSSDEEEPNKGPLPTKEEVPNDEPLSIDEYDREILPLFKNVDDIEHQIAVQEKGDNLSWGAATRFHQQLDAIEHRLHKLDDRLMVFARSRPIEERALAHPDQSLERIELRRMIGDIRHRYPLRAYRELPTYPPPVAPSVPVELSSIQEKHADLRARYASVQHTLTDEQRRVFREKFARLSAIVREQEGTPVAPPEQTVITTADIPQESQSQDQGGLFSLLGRAFRLKP